MKSHSTQALGATCPFLSALLVACTARTPPIAAQRPFVIKSLHGERVDEYYWMRDDDDAKKSPEIMAHLNAEQAYATACLQRLAPLQETLVAEMRGLKLVYDETQTNHRLNCREQRRPVDRVDARHRGSTHTCVAREEFAHR